jgi:hypothetical protein
MLHLRPVVREEFMPWLEETYPDLVERYAELYRTPYGPKAEREVISKQVHALIDRTPRPRGALAPRFRRPASRVRSQQPEQPALW